MAWINETLRVFGFINRQHLMRMFRISEPQASIDLRNFNRLNPCKMFYHPSRKCYVATKQKELK